jgi:alcohol dehydrogenase
VLNGQVQPGDTVAIVGAGPVGLAAILGARLYSPAAIVTIDPTPARRDWAETFGANVVATPEQARAEIDRLTDGLGADVAVEAVGIPATFEQCTELIRPGGRVANVGVHGKPATLHPEDQGRHHHHRPGGHVLDPDPAKSVAAGQIDPTRFTTRRFPLQEAIQAYDTFARAGETNAPKVLLTIEG